MIIDFHTHIFPDFLASRVLGNLSSYAGHPPSSNLTMTDTLAKMDEYNIDKSVVLSIATRIGNQKDTNDFAIGLKSERLLPFGSVHPFAPDATRELDRIKENGLYGIKLHPQYQGFDLSDESVYPVYEHIDKLGLPVIFHCGYDPLIPSSDAAHSSKIIRIKKEFPNLKIVAAHMGGINIDEDVESVLIGEDIYIDVSMAMYAFAGKIDEYSKLLRSHPIDKILFASDLPWGNPKTEYDNLMATDLSDDMKERILYKNALQLLDIKL